LANGRFLHKYGKPTLAFYVDARGKEIP